MELLEELEKPIKQNIGESDKRKGYFCTETIFNLINRGTCDSKIKLFKKGLDYAAIQRKINEPELRKNFNEFCGRMKIKWNCRNELSQYFSEIPSFRANYSWKSPKGCPNLEVFLSKAEEDRFKVIETTLNLSNLKQKKWQTVLSLDDDKSIVIKNQLKVLLQLYYIE